MDIPKTVTMQYKDELFHRSVTMASVTSLKKQEQAELKPGPPALWLIMQETKNLCFKSSFDREFRISWTMALFHCLLFEELKIAGPITFSIVSFIILETSSAII